MSSQNYHTHSEVIVVGTGIGGLAAAKTYLELSPLSEILMIEKRSCLGGVWSKDNCYEGLRTNNLYGTYEFSDFPMDAQYGVEPDSHIPGFTMNNYLNDFADHFDLRRLIHFDRTVCEVAKMTNGWMLLTNTTSHTGRNDGNSGDRIYTCNKLIMSTGLASNPNPITIAGQERFDRPILSHADLPYRAPMIAQDPNFRTITVIGASKTGYDAVNLFASHGKRVNWIIRESGGGAIWMSKPWVSVFGKRVQLEHLAATRLFSWFSPCIWGEYDGYGWIRRFLHGTRFGRYLVHLFWEKMRIDTIDENGYRKENLLKDLEPQESLFWSARVGILNYPSDIHEYIRSGKVKLVKKDIVRLCSGGGVHLKDDMILNTDALIVITGWTLTPTVKYRPSYLESGLGIPSDNLSAEDQAFWQMLDQAADEEILRKFPSLKAPPQKKIPYECGLSPFRLYRGIVPPELTINGDHSLAFMKMVHCTSNVVLAEIQALWVYAYLNNRVLIDKDDVYHQTAVLSRFGKHRYPCGFSRWYPEFVYDIMPYADMLLSDLGIKAARKRSLFREICEGYTVHDYRGINQEWNDKESKDCNQSKKNR